MYFPVSSAHWSHFRNSRTMESQFSLSPESLAPSVIRHAGCARHLRNSETCCSVSSFIWDRTCLCTALEVNRAFTFYVGCSKHPQRRMLCVRAHMCPENLKCLCTLWPFVEQVAGPGPTCTKRCSSQWATREPGRKRGPRGAVHTQMRLQPVEESLTSWPLSTVAQ